LELGATLSGEVVVEGAVSDELITCEAKLLAPVAEVLPDEVPVWPSPPELTKLLDCDDTKLEAIEDVESGAPLVPVVLCVIDPPVVLYCIVDTLGEVVKLMRLVC